MALLDANAKACRREDAMARSAIVELKRQTKGFPGNGFEQQVYLLGILFLR